MRQATIDDYCILPSQWERIEYVLKTFGGWSRMFVKSGPTWDSEHIVMRESDPGFWIMWAKTKAEEYFEEEVTSAYIEYREEYPRQVDPRPKQEILILLSKAILEEGWKPPKTRILKEIRELKQKRGGTRS